MIYILTLTSLYDVGVKSPRLWYLRIVSCYALPQISPIFAYRGIIIPLLCSYRGGTQGLSPIYEQAHVGLDLLPLVSLYNLCWTGFIMMISFTWIRIRVKNVH